MTNASRISLSKYIFLLFSLLFLKIAWYYSQPAPLIPSKTKLELIDTVASEPKHARGVQSFNLGIYKIVTVDNVLIHYGDRVKISGKTSKTGNVIYYPEIKILEPSPTGFWWQSASFIRSKVLAIYQTVLPRSSADLLSGIVLGGQGLDRNFKDRLAKVGLTHVVAASGMNITFVFVAITGLLNFLRFNRHFKILIALSLILFYSTLTGFDPPIVRAGIMAGFSSIAILLGRQSSGVAGLCVAAYLMLWVSPNLIISASFLLSFTAMAGQIFLSSLKFDLPKIITPVINVFFQSMVALVFTFPIVVIFFSNFSLISLFTNVIVLWTIEPLMILGGLLASLGFFFTPFARGLALPAQGLLEFFLWVVNTFSQINFLRFSFTFPDTTSALIFATGYYLFLSSILLIIRVIRSINKEPRISTSN